MRCDQTVPRFEDEGSAHAVPGVVRGCGGAHRRSLESTLSGVSALVVTYNNADEIAATLDALLAQQVTGGLEVVVVDNASTDGTADIIRGYADRVQLIARESNAGYAAGNNQALASSSGRVIALVNPDCVLRPGCLAALVAHLEEQPGVGMAAALLYNSDGSPQLFARRDLALRSALWAFTEAGARADRRLRGGRHAAHRRYADQWPPTEPMAVDCPAAACVALWRQLVPVRLFDEQLPLLFNDADLDRRLRRKGYRLDVVPSAAADHGYGTSLRRVARGRMRAERLISLRSYARKDWGVIRCAALWGLLALDIAFLLAPSLIGRKRGLNRTLLRGTLGGLGLPGGLRPWLAKTPDLRSRLKALVRRLRARPRAVVVTAGRRLRRLRFISRLRWAAWKARCTLEIDISKVADIGRGITIELWPATAIHVGIGAHSHVRDGVVLRLGGTLDVGTGVDIRWGAVLNVKGHLVLGNRVTLGRGVAIHADGYQEWGFSVLAAEYVSVIDTQHEFDGFPVATLDQPVLMLPISIGAGTFLGTKATVTPGVVIGSRVRVGAGAVVTRSLPDGVFAVGIPAAIVHPKATRKAAE